MIDVMNFKKKIPTVVLLIGLFISVGMVVSYLMNPDERITMENDSVSTTQLIGQWLRQDGGYLIDIDKINDDGTMEVAYYNPKNINVSQATVSLEKQGLKMFIELRDANYPGSTYTLHYLPKRDILGGTYFHAVSKRNYQVIFIRKEEKMPGNPASEPSV